MIARWMTVLALAAALAALGPMGWAASDGPTKPRGDGATVERADDAKTQLKRADEVRRAVRGKGDARRAALAKAAAGYEAVLSFFPDAKLETSTAAFRLGEIRRSLREGDAARDAFARVVSIGGDRRLAARAVLETGHLYRRAKELGRAMESYRRAATEYPDETGTRDDALYWIGTLHASALEYGKAREAWQAIADRGVDPLDRVRAFDRIAASWIKEGDAAAAARTIDLARTTLHDQASDPSPRGERVKKALARMRSARSLEPAKPAAGASSAHDDDDPEDDDDEE